MQTVASHDHNPAAFEPRAYLLGTSTVPQGITIFGITGGWDRWCRVSFDLSKPPITYVAQTIAVVRRTPLVPFFGKVTGFIICYSPTYSVRFDLLGMPVETMREWMPGKVSITLGGHELKDRSLFGS